MDDDDTADAPACPKCGQRMQLVRIIPGSFSIPELRSFACRPCKEVITKACEDG